MNNWFLPENLYKKEAETRTKDLSQLDAGGDFASYRIMLETGNMDQARIAEHNDVQPEQKISILKNRLEREGLLNFPFERILNLGCGLGFETKSIAEVFKRETLGIDISTDAIVFANEKFKNEQVSFQCIGVDADMKLEHCYDICFAIEFYPFTRTNDKELQQSIVKAIFDNMSEKGVLVVYQVWDNELSIKNNIYDIARSLGKRVYISPYMNKKLNNKLGDNLISAVSLWLLKNVSALMGRTLKPSKLIAFH
ncbi:MAG: class I SAM-dependent methyltransferase [Sphingobacteriaceae bacterium]|nr:class I SAM-dependent methyltransferase [Sphingobacteriaceae bacterium]